MRVWLFVGFVLVLLITLWATWPPAARATEPRCHAEIACIHFLSISTFIVDLSHMEILEFAIDTFAIGLSLFMVFWTAYNGFSQPEIFKQHLSLTEQNLGSIEPTRAPSLESTVLGLKKTNRNLAEESR